MPSIHEEAVREEVVDRLVREGDPWADELLGTAMRMNEGFYPQSLLDSVVQKGWGSERFDQYDAHSFLCVLSYLYTGNLYRIDIHVGVQPMADRQIEANNAALSQLPPAFQAKFHGGQADNDGSVQWTKPIAMQRCVLDVKTDIEDLTYVEIKPRSVPLEVGSTMASRTLLHIRMEGGIARWPYGSGYIHLWVLSDEAFAESQKRLTAGY